MWPAFGFFTLLPVLFIFLVLHMVRVALRETRGQRRSEAQHRIEALWSRDHQKQMAAREQPRSRRLENRVFRLADLAGGSPCPTWWSTWISPSRRRRASQPAGRQHPRDHGGDDGLVYYEFPEIIARRNRDDDDLPSRV